MCVAALSYGAGGFISFDEYVGLLAEVTALTNQFRRCGQARLICQLYVLSSHLLCSWLRSFDTAGRGSATLEYASFLQIVYSTRS